MYILLDSYNYNENNVELSEYRAFGIASIAQNRRNSKMLLRILNNYPNFYNEHLCYDMMSTEEIEYVINNLKQICGFKDVKSKILLILNREYYLQSTIK